MDQALQGARRFDGFGDAARAVLSFLQERHPLGLWMVTRTIDDDWIVLRSADRDYGVHDGDVLRWSDSFCSRMVRGEGPNVAPDATQVPAYLAAPIGQQLPIGAYVGFPLTRDGELFGTLCAIDPDPQADDLAADSELIGLLSGLLSTILDAEMDNSALQQQADQLTEAVHHDPVTGALNRSGWQRLIERADTTEQYGVVMVHFVQLRHLNESRGQAAADHALVRAGEAIRRVTRGRDVVARIQGGEFGIVLTGSDALAPEAFVQRLQLAARQNRTMVAIGAAVGEGGAPLADVIALAQARMASELAAMRDH
ncbi:MAG: diguanylate cyclase [Candidatus Nanopelagicales bacterium]